jgi:hypothetical protein
VFAMQPDMKALVDIINLSVNGHAVPSATLFHRRHARKNRLGEWNVAGGCTSFSFR